MAAVSLSRNSTFWVPFVRWMVSGSLIFLLGLIFSPYLLPDQVHPPLASLAELPLAFVPNQGQNEAAVQYQMQNVHSRLDFLANGVRVSGRLEETAVAWGYRFVGANEQVKIAAANQLPGTVNYLLGSDPDKWQTNLPTYASLQYTDLYPGIDIRFLGRPEALSTFITVAPGSDVGAMQWQYDTAVQLDNATGQINLIFNTPDQAPITTTALLAPIAWQTIDGTEKTIPVHYQPEQDQSVTLSVGHYDPDHPLFIVTQSPLGWGGWDYITDLAVDSAGYAYVIGTTDSPSFPVLNGVQMNLGGGSDGFVTKFNLDGTDIIYSTYLGGSGYDSGWGIAIDANGQALLTGTTTSTDFPLLNPMQAVSGGSNDVFITRLSADGGALIYSTYLGGSAIDWAYAIVHDTAGNAYIAGSTSSTNFPVMNPFQATLSGSADGFVSKLTPTGNSLVYSTYLGGGDFEELQGMSINNLGQVYVAGTTNSPDFPVLNPIQPALAGNVDVFITQFSSNGASLEYSSYLGGSGEDRAGEVAVAQTGDIYLAGYTDSANFPIVNPWQATPGGVYDFFVTHLTANGTAFGYSTYLGGIGSEFYADIALDDGELFLVGNSLSEDYPVLNAIQPTLAGNNDIVITGLVNDGSALIFSTYYGGADGENGAAIALDEAGNVYVAGDTHSADFPTTPGAWQRAYAGLGDGFLLKLLSGGTAVGYSTYHGAYPGPTDVTLTDVGGTPVTSWWPFAFIGGLFLLVRGLYGWFAQKR